MKLVEYRVLLPMTLEEYEIALLYGVAEMSKRETGGGEGIEILTNETFDTAPDPPLMEGYNSGRVTKKIYHLKSKVPTIIRLFAPKGSLELVEDSWNAYPFSRTVYTNPKYMKEKFSIKLESFHAQDSGQQDNVHNLTPAQLAKREVIYIDIANDKYPEMKEYDPRKYKSVKTGRGPLEGNWKDRTTPLMCCYKLVSCEFKWLGLQGKVESMIQKMERRIFCEFHRNVFCWMDLWHDMTMEDIRVLEERTKQDLDQQRKHGELRGTKDMDE